MTSRFGGILRSSSEPLKGRQASRPPVNIRGRLFIVDSGEDSKPVRPRFSRHKVLIIPAGAAFGTGDHATTSSCLRLLADVSDEYAGHRWRCLDLGTGTGILAMAAEQFGADAVDAWDFDKDAVRTAKENVRVNGMKHLRLAVRDVLRWTPERQWDVICANLYSDVLIKAATKICEALLPGGKLIVSGILRAQEADCLKAFNELKFSARSGKGSGWRCLPPSELSRLREVWEWNSSINLIDRWQRDGVLLWSFTC